jgi:hypothetical protein
MLSAGIDSLIPWLREPLGPVDARIATVPYHTFLETGYRTAREAKRRYLALPNLPSPYILLRSLRSYILFASFPKEEQTLTSLL